jgi:ribosomal protein S18 acetylase RimI-like enzyme
VLYDLLVSPADRGHGTGTRLLEATLDALTALGAPRVVLSTAERNDGAQQHFTRAGFRRTMVEMTRELDGQS